MEHISVSCPYCKVKELNKELAISELREESSSKAMVKFKELALKYAKEIEDYQNDIIRRNSETNELSLKLEAMRDKLEEWHNTHVLGEFPSIEEDLKYQKDTLSGLWELLQKEGK